VGTLNDLNKKVEEANLKLRDMDNSKRRTTTENADLLSQLQELQGAANLILQTKSALVSELDEQRRISETQSRERLSLLGKYRNLEHEAEGLKQNFDEEVGSKDNICNQLHKALGEVDVWRQKYEEGMAKLKSLKCQS
jgi:chromosome segregation ATPase